MTLRPPERTARSTDRLKRSRSPWSMVALIVTSLALVLAGCSTPIEPSKSAAPTIDSFSAAPNEIEQGQTSTLSWSVSGQGTTITIADGATTIHTTTDLDASLDVQPSTTTTYTLTATSKGGNTTETTTITVSTPSPNAPTITSFSATPTAIEDGQTSTLSWSVTGQGTTITIADGATTIHTTTDLDASLTVQPTSTTTYTLTATNPNGEITQTTTITVTTPTASAPTITSFDANRTNITAGGQATLSWTVTGQGTTITIRAGTTTIHTTTDLDASLTVQPSTTTTYTLTATNEGGESTQTTTITVSAPSPNAPIITFFSATPTAIEDGQTSTLSWSVTGQDTTITIQDDTDTLFSSDDLADLEAGLTVQPSTTTTYTLTATNADGETTRTATITVTAPQDPPTIDSFSASPTSITTGQQATLNWTVTGQDTTITIQAGTTTIHTTTALDANLTVQPTSTTTYTLTATNESGSVTQTTTITVTAPPPPDLTGLTATTLTGSRVGLTWTVSGAVSIEVYAAASSSPSAPANLVTTLGGGVTSHTMPIPASNRQTVRVCALAAGGAQTCLSTGLTNVVTNSDDYDPYDLEGFTPEPEIPGSLRSVILNAAPGAVIGFASDVSTILIRGVDLLQLSVWQDAHLILNKNLTISGRVGAPVTLQGTSAWLDGGPGDPFTYRSRMIYVVQGSTVELENLVITGGTFIYKGGGIRNDGTLTVRNSLITGNRAWEHGGGIWNNATGNLTVLNSQITANQALTTDAEIAQGSYEIRDGYEIPMFPAGQGGGVYNQPGGVLTMSGSSVQGNQARFEGGGVYVAAGSNVSVSGTAISSNQAGEPGSGGGIHHVYDSGDIGSLAFGSGVSITGNDPENLVQVEAGTAGTSVTSSSHRLSVPDR